MPDSDRAAVPGATESTVAAGTFGAERGVDVDQQRAVEPDELEPAALADRSERDRARWLAEHSTPPGEHDGDPAAHDLHARQMAADASRGLVESGE
ncbi:MAG: hypothetical protein EPO13_05630 [Actinomycetota bacterium]|nr:MAG: hypothetical protein EPO13_05630 [Actinomycetota bacterium]